MVNDGGKNVSENGDNKPKKNGKKTACELIQWINPDTVPFKATDRQKAFRRLARRLVSNGTYFKKDWYKESAKSAAADFKDHPVGPKEWRKWCRNDKFGAWFFEDFPEVEKISEEELRMLDNQWWDGVHEGMSNGESWAFDKYAKVRFSKEEAQRNTAETKELSEYLRSSSSGAKWRLPSAEA